MTRFHAEQPQRVTLDWGRPDAAELRNRRRRLNAPIDGPYRRPGWLSRLARWLGWMAGAQ